MQTAWNREPPRRGPRTGLLAAMTLCLLAAPAGPFVPGAFGQDPKSFDSKLYRWEWPADFDPNGQMVVRWSAEPETLNVVTSKDVYASLIQGYCYVDLLDRHPRFGKHRPGQSTIACLAPRPT